MVQIDIWSRSLSEWGTVAFATHFRVILLVKSGLRRSVAS